MMHGDDDDDEEEEDHDSDCDCESQDVCNMLRFQCQLLQDVVLFWESSLWSVCTFDRLEVLRLNLHWSWAQDIRW